MTTVDDFLGGKVHLKQAEKGLRATSDSVLVAAAVPARVGDSILDVGTGNGVIALCLNARIKDLKITGVDCQKELLQLAAKNAKANECNLKTVLMDIGERPPPLHGQQFHHVVTNPPFYDEPRPRADQEQDIAYHQKVSLTEWLRFCLRHVRAKGSLSVIARAVSLLEILNALEPKLGALEVFPIASKAGDPASRIIVRGRMNSRQKLKLYPPLVMHEEDGCRTETAEKLLRQGMSIDAVKGLDI